MNTGERDGSERLVGVGKIVVSAEPSRRHERAGECSRPSVRHRTEMAHLALNVFADTLNDGDITTVMPPVRQPRQGPVQGPRAVEIQSGWKVVSGRRCRVRPGIGQAGDCDAGPGAPVVTRRVGHTEWDVRVQDVIRSGQLNHNDDRSSRGKRRPKGGVRGGVSEENASECRAGHPRTEHHPHSLQEFASGKSCSCHGRGCSRGRSRRARHRGCLSRSVFVVCRICRKSQFARNSGDSNRRFRSPAARAGVHEPPVA